MDLTRSKPELMLENMLLRQQLIVLKRQVKRPALSWRDRTLFVLLASRLGTWKQALVIVQPETVLRWHRDLIRSVWRRKSRPNRRGGKPALAGDTVVLIKKMAKENRTWGAERIRGELLKLDLRVSKSTIQKYIYQVRKLGSPKQTWATFLHNHATEIWACDFLQTYDLFFRALFVFVIIELDSRRLVHFDVTRNPTDAWVAQQLREATPFAEGPRYLIRDNDSKYGSSFARVAAGTGIEVLRTPYGAPKANAICERFLGSVRRECLDHFLILSERHLYRVLKEYRRYFNHARPHQGIGQKMPCSVSASGRATEGWRAHLSPSVARIASRLLLARAWATLICPSRLTDGNIRPGQVAQALAVNELYDKMWLYYNFFQPVMRLAEKTWVQEEGQSARVKRRFDSAATPFDRLCATKAIPKELAEQLRTLREQTNPRQLRQEINELLVYIAALPCATPGVTEDVRLTLRTGQQDVASHLPVPAVARPITTLKRRGHAW